jgi:hypothetical protein
MMEAVSHQHSAVSKRFASWCLRFMIRWTRLDGGERHLSKKKLIADGRKLTAKRGETT